MERRDFLKLTLGLVAAAGAVASTMVTTAEAATPPKPDAKGPPGAPKPDESAVQDDQLQKAQSEPDELSAVEADDTDFSARRWWRRRRRIWYRRRRRWWRRRRRVFFRRRRRWWRRRRRVYYY